MFVAGIGVCCIEKQSQVPAEQTTTTQPTGSVATETNDNTENDGDEFVVILRCALGKLGASVWLEKSTRKPEEQAWIISVFLVKILSDYCRLPFLKGANKVEDKALVCAFAGLTDDEIARCKLS
eukprot:TRINITY_DN15099_c0_g1_i1.p1 TRINITY_DN15099_c0_g1~~TRINITY_DN15099_c0_g1_i1.p1  ORF type:complete len:124 (-),score=29.98 TRINITY_DN15099_c0_g1_i1:13-384(-)